MGCGCNRNKSVAPTTNQSQSLYTTPTIIKQEDLVKIRPLNQPVETETIEESKPASLNGLRSLATKIRGNVIRSIEISGPGQSTPTKMLNAAQENSIPVVKSDRRYNLMNVIKDTISGEAQYVSEEKLKSRLAICKACPSLLAGACTKCGCIVQLKAKYEESSCPVDKW